MSQYEVRKKKTTPKIQSTHSETIHIGFLSNKTFIIVRHLLCCIRCVQFIEHCLQAKHVLLLATSLKRLQIHSVTAGEQGEV
jgi:hypothetical protein